MDNYNSTLCLIRKLAAYSPAEAFSISDIVSHERLIYTKEERLTVRRAMDSMRTAINAVIEITPEPATNLQRSTDDQVVEALSEELPADTSFSIYFIHNSTGREIITLVCSTKELCLEERMNQKLAALNINGKCVVEFNEGGSDVNLNRMCNGQPKSTNNLEELN